MHAGGQRFKSVILHHFLKDKEKTAEEVFIPLTVGGGVRSIENIQNLLKAGADKVSINSAAIKDPNIIKSSSNFLLNFS